MNVRPIFFFALMLTLLNVVAGVVMGHVFPFFVAVFCAIATVSAASKIWPDVVRKRRIKEERTENIYGYCDEDLTRNE